MDGGMPEQDAPGIAAYTQPSAREDASQPVQAGGGGEEDRDAAYARELAAQMDDADYARQLAAQFEAEESASELASQRPTGASDPSAVPPTTRAEGGGLRVAVLGAEGAGDERSAHIVYRLQVLPHGVETRKRFSSFTELLTRLGKESGVGAERGSAAAGVVDNWKRQLTIEKRHTGKASRAEPVVSGRCTLFQRMFDELTTLPELASSAVLANFLFAPEA